MRTTTMTTKLTNVISRRSMLATATGAAAGLLATPLLSQDKKGPMVQTVLGSVAPDKLGATLMHEHAPIVDWSELYETKPAPVAAVREKMLAKTASLLDAFHDTLAADEGPGTIVEATPIRVGRYPQLLVDLAKRTEVHIIASSGFWCESLAPQHPWAVRLGIHEGGIEQMAGLFIREVAEGMEDPGGEWGEKFTKIKAGIIKIGTSTFLRPSERACHIAAAIASKTTGCPVTTHTTNGGGLEEAELLLKHGAAPSKVINPMTPKFRRRLLSIVALGSLVGIVQVGLRSNLLDDPQAEAAVPPVTESSDVTPCITAKATRDYRVTLLGITKGIAFLDSKDNRSGESGGN